ncbi:unnamed protein product [Plutella xylostella]|uniref:(diamondback moth) hypothetical protein n=1 Tax=Plutella xylostella TaxID=51655 RepID=A0A8S4DKS7_PLUXY|nr:unnamed protein product [Plutella xylostella]
MSSRSKEKVAAAFRKLFRSPEKLDKDGAGPSGSPARRGLLRRHRDGVSPAEAAASMPPSPGAMAKKAIAIASTSEARERAAAVRTRRLMKELKEIQRLQESRPEPIFTVELVNDNLFEWHVRLHQIDPESELAGDLRELHVPHILLHLVFPENFPFAPPFMRVIEPRIEKGFVMEGFSKNRIYRKNDPESELAGDLRELHVPHILLHLVFPENFPFAPPFMRVIEPRIEKGFVIEGFSKNSIYRQNYPESELAGDLRELHVPHILLHLVFPENFPFAPPFMRVIEPRIEKGFVIEGFSKNSIYRQNYPESELAGDLRELHVPHILLHLVFPENFPFAPPFMRVIEPRIEKGFVIEGFSKNSIYRQNYPESELAGDLRELHVPHILLHLVFPENFPFAPPFMRVVEPRIEKGFVMDGGAICMELLTPRGWASAYTVEAVVMQFAASVVKGQGRVARAPPRPAREFSRRRAEEAFRSLVKTHDKYGWVTPSLSDG